MNELVRIDNLLKLFKRANFTLTGEEALILAQCFEYLMKRKESLSEPIPSPVQPVPVPAPVSKPVKKGKK